MTRSWPSSGSAISGMTQSEPAGLIGSQITGLVFGAGLVVAAFATLEWRKRRSRAARDERPPQQAKILRPAGYWLTCRLNELTEHFNSSLLQALAAGAVLGLVGTALFPVIEGLLLQRFSFAEIRGHPKSYIFLSGILVALSALAWAIRSIIQAHQIDGNIRNYRLALRGEQAVAEALTDSALAAAGYVAFHDVPGDGLWNVDHIVVGPGGIFVLETKARSRRKATRDQPDHEVWFDGQNLQFPWCNDREAAAQAERNARWVKHFTSGFAPKDIPVHPVVVIPGWYVKAQGNYLVKAMNAKYLVTDYLLPFKRHFSPQELQTVVRRLDERCRDLEF